MMTLEAWAAKWRVPFEALTDLRRQVFNHESDFTSATTTHDGHNEKAASVAVRLEASEKGLRIWRNNVGALSDETGRFVRYGLANDSKAVNDRIKSGDLIGIRPVRVTPEMIGHTIGQFVSREIKAPGWHYTATPREQAQQRWAELVRSLGGDAAFATGRGTL